VTATVDWDAVDENSEFTGNTMPRTPGGSRTGGTGGARRGRRVSDKRLSDLQSKLSNEMFQAGGMIGLGMPVTGYYIAQESDNFTNAIVTLAAKNSNWVAALENVAMVGPGITVGRTVLGIGAAMASDRYHRTGGESGLDPMKRSAMFLGVTTAYLAVHPPEGMRDYNASEGTYQPPPHSGFNPIS
jgi:hypothetical protein